MIAIDKKKNRKRKIIEKIIEKIFFISACVSIISVVIIMIFIFFRGTPAIGQVGIKNFILGKKWDPMADIYGIFPMIVASLYATIGAILIGVPTGVLMAVFMAEIAPKWLQKIIRPVVELLAGIPSVIYGFFGLLVIVPLIDEKLGGGGNSLLAAIIILGVMILPTIITISESAIKSVAVEYKEGSLAMGASHIQTIFKVIIPAAKSGIIAAIILGIGRAVGETMAVILVAGNTVQVPNSILNRVRTLTANIAIEMGYAYGLHSDVLFATGVVLFVFIMILNLTLNYFTFKVSD